jgi:hypothetical protein
VAMVLACANAGTAAAKNPAASSSAARLRYCGEAPQMIANSVRASPGVSCGEAKHLIKALLGGSQACYPNGYTPHPHCRVDGYRCYSWGSQGGPSHGRCVKGRREVTGVAGP